MFEKEQAEKRGENEHSEEGEQDEYSDEDEEFEDENEEDEQHVVRWSYNVFICKYSQLV